MASRLVFFCRGTVGSRLQFARDRVCIHYGYQLAVSASCMLQLPPPPNICGGIFFSSKKGDRDGSPTDDLLDEIEKAPFDSKYSSKVIEENPIKAVDEDPFGLAFDDGSDGLGPKLPPSYVRDKTTGAFTGEIESELTQSQKQLLSADRMENDKRLLDEFENHWKKEGLDESGSPAALNKLGKRIRECDMSLNVIGRSVRSQASAEELDDGTEMGRDKNGFSQQLTKKEFNSFSAYMKTKHGVIVTEDDIPIQDNKSTRTKKFDKLSREDPDQKELSLKWLTARAQRQLDDSLDDNPFSDLMPGDLSPSRLVNRRRAKKIPRKLLHQNNIELLQHFLAPTGLIRNRVQTRLGARDQRRVAQLIRRARNMGLIPYSGRYKAENHGWKNSPNIIRGELSDWERVLLERGLVPRKSAEGTTDQSSSETSST